MLLALTAAARVALAAAPAARSASSDLLARSDAKSAGPLATSRAPAGGSAPEAVRRSLWKRFKSSAKKTGVVVTAGIDLGLPLGAGGAVCQGLKFSPRDGETKAKLRTFTQVQASLGLIAHKRVFSPSKSLRGFENQIVGVGRSSPVYGDRVLVPIIPGVIMVGASRLGGLGLSVSGLPFPFFYPVLRTTASFYVSHPGLARVSNPLLDRVDRVVAGARKLGRASRARMQR
ncbi:MAG TPA: hypothetical protein VKN99_07005, partial [Polyangia bacterium]|nr:hypothetical protein [Polyangia bacterium]